MKRAAAVVLMLALAAGCGKKVKTSAAAAPPPNSTTTREYVDIQPGWRITVVAAVTKSGKYEVETKAVKEEGNVITLKASDDLVGFETAIWSVLARPNGGGVALRLLSAELNKVGDITPLAKPDRAVIHVPPSAHYLRAFYFTRQSKADHNMALAGSAKPEQLEAFTRVFRETPNEACADFSKHHHYCEWIPAGVAVRAEAQSPAKP